MGQKINTFGMRLKNRLNWNYTFCVHKNTKFNEVFFNSHQLDFVNKLIFSNLAAFPDSKITRNSKKFIYQQSLQAKLKLLTQRQNINSDVVTNKSKKLQPSHNLYYGFWQTKQQVQYNCVDLFYNKNKKEFLRMLTPGHSTTEHTRLLSARFFTQFIAKQLHKNSALKENKSFNMSPSFSKGLYIGILQLIYSVIEPFKLSVNGIKIICSGKWKKSRSGRKQKLVIKIGNIRNASLNNILLYDYQATKTKFGSCGIKVWISHKKIV